MNRVNKQTALRLIAVMLAVLLLMMAGCGAQKGEKRYQEVRTLEFVQEVEEESREEDREELPEEKPEIEKPVQASQGEEEIEKNPAPELVQELEGMQYILNTNTKKFHKINCSSVGQMKEYNKEYFTGDKETVIDRGFVPCKRCKP